MHKLTDSVNNKTNIWAGEGNTLKSTHDLMKCVGSKNELSDSIIAFEGETEVST
jgi:hypothetical protein